MLTLSDSLTHSFSDSVTLITSGASCNAKKNRKSGENLNQKNIINGKLLKTFPDKIKWKTQGPRLMGPRDKFKEKKLICGEWRDAAAAEGGKSSESILFQLLEARSINRAHSSCSSPCTPLRLCKVQQQQQQQKQLGRKATTAMPKLCH